MTNGITRVLVVDDRTTVREGIGAVLEPEWDISIVGEVADGRQAVKAAETLHQVDDRADPRPTLIVAPTDSGRPRWVLSGPTADPEMGLSEEARAGEIARPC